MDRASNRAAPDRDIVLLGVDGGGTRCRARLARLDGRVVGEGFAGPANLRLGLMAALAAVGEAEAQALASAGLGRTRLPTVACLALAGASEPFEQQAANATPHPYLHRAIVTDAHAACIGAHDGGDGGIVIVGTGSIGWANVRGRSHRIGGYGLPLSDEGSGAWLGREALRRLLHHHDGLAPRSDLLADLSRRFRGDPAQVVRWASTASPGDFAAFAPAVVSHAKSGDAVAAALLRCSGRYVGRLLRGLRGLGAPRLSLMGGLAESMQPWLPQSVSTMLSPPLGDALSGALRIARETAQQIQRQRLAQKGPRA